MATKARRARRSKRLTQINPRWILAGAALVIAVGLGLLYITRDTSTIAPQSIPSQPELTTDFTLPGLDGTVSLADFRGRYVLVNFWASWCPPCIAEMPELYAYHLAHQDQGFTLLAVNMGETAETASRFIRDNGFDFPVALDLNGVVFDRYGTNSLPSSFLIGPDGRLVKAWEPGRISLAMLERDVTPLLVGG